MQKYPQAWRPALVPAELATQMQRARQLGIEFLDTELQMAQAFLDLAETTSNAAACGRNIQNTAKALDAVDRFIKRLNPELPQRQRLTRRARELRRRLADTPRRLHSISRPEQPPAGSA